MQCGIITGILVLSCGRGGCGIGIKQIKSGAIITQVINNNPSLRVVANNKNLPPKDEKLAQLVKQAHAKEIKCHIAVIRWEGIKHFSDFQPKISNDFAALFLNKLRTGSPPQLLVYQDGNDFIMSEDYAKYYLYKQLEEPFVRCVVLGDPSSTYVVAKGEPFDFYAPTVTVVRSKG